MKNYFLISMFLILFLNFSPAQVSLVKDFNGTATGSINTSSGDAVITHVNGRMIFKISALEGADSKRQLWATDGTTSGTEKLLSIPYEDEEYYPSFYDFTPVSPTQVAFIAAYLDTLYAVYVTDGTVANTIKVAQSKEYISAMESLKGNLYFATAQENGFNYLLRKVDMSDNNVSDIYEFGYMYYIYDMNKINEDTLVMLAPDGTEANINLKLFISDGTTTGTKPIKLIYDGNGVTQQTLMTKIGDRVFFFHKENGADCCNNLWVTDGTTAGTAKIKEFNIVASHDYLANRSVLTHNGKFYFMGVDAAGNINNDRALWVSDGTLAGTLALHNPDDYSRSKSFTVLNNKIYFIAYSQNSYQNMLYVTDGTVQGTMQAPLMYNGSMITDILSLTSDGSNLYLSGYTSQEGYEVFAYSGTGTNTLLHEGSDGTDNTDPTHLFHLNGNILFFGSTVTTGNELYKLGTLLSLASGKIRQEQIIYPNPATDKVYAKHNQTIVSMTIKDLSGHTVAEGEAAFLNLDGLSNGLYIVTVLLQSGDVYINKLVLNK